MSEPSTNAARLRQLADAIEGALGAEDDPVVDEWASELRAIADDLADELRRAAEGVR